MLTFLLAPLILVGAITHNAEDNAGFGWEVSSSSEKVTYPPAMEGVMPIVNGGWYPFWFGESGTWAFQSFILSASGSFGVGVTDAFCGGDSFALYDNGYFVGLVDTSCIPNDHTCPQYTTDPDTAFASGSTCCTGLFDLSAGFHNFTLLVVASPFGYGQGFIFFSQAT